MSVKAVNDYYKQISDQYFEMVQDIKDFEKEAEEGLIEPERVERLKEQIEPIKNNYERWCYMMYLLHQPQRKSKQKKYQQMLLASLDDKNSLDGVLAENKEALKHIGE